MFSHIQTTLVFIRSVVHRQTDGARRRFEGLFPYTPCGAVWVPKSACRSRLPLLLFHCTRYGTQETWFQSYSKTSHKDHPDLKPPRYWDINIFTDRFSGLTLYLKSVMRPNQFFTWPSCGLNIEVLLYFCVTCRQTDAQESFFCCVSVRLS